MINMLKILGLITSIAIVIALIILRKKTTHLLKNKSVQTPGEESTWLLRISTALVLILAIAQYVRLTPNATPLMWGGAGAFALGLLIHISAKKSLGETRTLEEYLLIKEKPTGIYKKIRHPQYTALLLGLAGICFALASPWALLLYVSLLIPSTLYRIAQEEQTLLDKFDQDFTAYQADTKKIIPFFL